MTQYQGLSAKEAKERQQIYGRNEINVKRHRRLGKKLLHIIKEPIYLLLVCSSVIYFILGEQADGAVMIGFVLFVIGIDVFQDIRTGNALRKLKEISTPKVRVIREGKEMLLPSAELVPGDIIIISEGDKIPADTTLLEASGLCVDESILTGESLGVWKFSKEELYYKELQDSLQDVKEEEYFKRDCCYAGTLVILGTGVAIVEKTGCNTEYGKIAEQVANAPSNHSLLQRQLKKLSMQCTLIAAIFFVLVSFFTFFNLVGYSMSERIIHSMLAGVVLALSMIPGEFPVILSVFFSMGALRLARKKALVRHLPVVETLGAISVLCMDKTGTITQNKMQVAECYIADRQESKFCKIMTLSCREGTYDPVENAMLKYGRQLCSHCKGSSEEIKACSMIQKKLALVKEYAFTNELKAMGQVWEEEGEYIISAKGSPETILSLCTLTKREEKQAKNVIRAYLEKGLRVIAIADNKMADRSLIPEHLTDCKLLLRGVIGLADPIREDIEENIRACYEAGIRVIMITGDHPVTAKAIAKRVGIKLYDRVVTGDEISKMEDSQLKESVKECNLFARVLPLHKMRIVKALKDNNEIVAMTGDGVNDSPAQKMADIGIAMGKHGSDVCREAADLILLDDNLSTILNTVKDGRRIYHNIGKTIGYVFSIHIPIALISLAAPMLGIGPEMLMLLPLHIILLELVMDPTCSITLERQPCEDDIMIKPPRNPKESLLTRQRLLKSMIQGTVIFLASFGIYLMLLNLAYPAPVARTAGFAILVLANVFLVLGNCSELEAVWLTLGKIKSDKGIWFVNLVTILGLFAMIYSPFHRLLGFAPLPAYLMLIVIILSLISVFWYELVKYRNRRKIERLD